MCMGPRTKFTYSIFHLQSSPLTTTSKTMPNCNSFLPSSSSSPLGHQLVFFFIALEMGQFCINLDVDIMGLVLALVIAIALMLTCVNQPPRPRPRPAMVVTHRIAW
ncbi:hypothetical protein J1N35_024414 [Gossypium stocksii]|uniref:Uncharacterized protein n=1 Tax=Gossypium stocksii TaxID=47602 RepID=A0A9D3V4P6_9ROSI|nr:hypothetical protein J1N35_024414 [Gossypium stocksii]